MTDQTTVPDSLPIDEAFARPASSESLTAAADALRANGFTVHIADTAAHARALVAGLVPEDRTVLTATSETLRESGIAADIDTSGRYRSLRAEQAGWDQAARFDEVRVTRSTPDLVVGSVHAVTEDGRLVTASASGSQLAPYVFGAAQAVFVVGAQKVVADLATALRRVETYSYPREDVRARSAYGQRSVLAKILVTGREIFPGRSTVVLVREPIGF
ncbi:LUD domain-containing protein [Actinacidiphila sp. ITFR-21]|uniref:LUD domain-containing protein n=1 Tax=Actinacidiphila sp. ITFR-21 TaxID=3075199 RepID=UPI002889E417|nr:LUD domain-containing protein [Streptomyces sp. ITFR-21]WNI14228.1 LUD domain-containing protein [Streptomyces sp. ITFR-21]